MVLGNDSAMGRRTNPSVEQRARPTQMSVCKGIDGDQIEELEARFSPENKSAFENEPFNALVADFHKPVSGNTAISNSINKFRREEELEAEVER